MLKSSTLRALYLLAAGLLAFGGITCTRLADNNPYSSTYPGSNYSLSIAAETISGSVFERISAVCSTGTDKFITLAVPETLSQYLDVSRLSFSNDDQNTIILYFIQPFAGTIEFQATHHNGTITRVTVPVSIQAPFEIRDPGLAALGDTVSLFCTPVASASIPRGVTLTVAAENREDSSLTITRDTACLVPVFGFAQDSGGHRICIDTLEVRFAGQRPLVHFDLADGDTLRPSLNGDTLYFQASGADSGTVFYWHSGMLDTSDTTHETRLWIVYESAGVDTLTLYAVSPEGLQGPTDRIIVRPEEKLYDLSWKESHQILRARRPAIWTVELEFNDSFVQPDSVQFTLENADTSVIMRANGDTCELSVPDGVASFVLKASAGYNDTLITTSMTIVVHAYLPWCTMLTPDTTVQLGDTIPLRIAAGDSLNEIIDTLHIRTSTGRDYYTPNQSPVMLQPFTARGTVTVRVTSIDRDGFESPQDSVILTVETTEPAIDADHSMGDTSVFLFDTVSLYAAAIPGNNGLSITRYLWDLDGDTAWDDSTDSGIYKIAFSDSGTYEIGVGCQTSLDISHSRHSFVITADPGRPRIIAASLSPLNPYINNQIHCAVQLFDPDSESTTLYYDLDNDGIDDSTHTLAAGNTVDTLVFSKAIADTYRVSVRVQDSDGFASPVWLLPETLVVDPGIPRVDSIVRSVNHPLYITDTVSFMIAAVDDKEIAHYHVQFDNGPDQNLHTVSSTAAVSFSDSGYHQITVYVVDNESNQSPRLIDSIPVLLGAPSVAITAIGPSPDSLYVLQPVSITISAADKNNSLVKLLVDWNEDGSPDDSITGFAVGDTTHTFLTSFDTTEADTVTVTVWAVDETNVRTSTTTGLRIRMGRPTVSNVMVDSSTVYVRDRVRFSVTADDSNGTVAAYMFSFDGSPWISGPQSWFDTTFKKDDFGSKILSVRATDNAGIASLARSFPFTVHEAAPVVDSMRPSTVWTNDDTAFTFSAYDPNGTVDSLLIDWGHGATSVILTDSVSADTALRHTFPIVFGDKIYDVEVIAVDDDGIRDTTTFPVMVLHGRPVVGRCVDSDTIQWVDGVGEDGDTMFYVWTSGEPTSVRVDVSDTNGTVQQIDWDWAEGFLTDQQTTEPVIQKDVSEHDVHEISVWATDDDGIVSDTFTFYVYPDEPPPAPAVSHIAPTADSIAIYWQNKDVKDDDFTEYRVLVHQGAEPDSTVSGDIVSDWQSGYRVDTTEGYDYFFRFKTLTPSMPKVTYFYQVHARDARGSITPCTSGHIFSY